MFYNTCIFYILFYNTFYSIVHNILQNILYIIPIPTINSYSLYDSYKNNQQGST
jgi:hypothetical protein